LYNDNLLQNPAFMAIKNAKVEQFDRVKETAIELLTLRSPMADLVIICEFEKYKVLAKNEEKYLVRKGQMGVLQFLFTYKNISDVWWQLPTHVRELWDAEPSLLIWRKQYR